MGAVPSSGDKYVSAAYSAAYSRALSDRGRGENRCDFSAMHCSFAQVRRYAEAYSARIETLGSTRGERVASDAKAAAEVVA